MPRVTDIDVLDKLAHPTLSIRTETAVHNLPVLIGPSYTKLAAHLKDLGECLSDFPYVAYHNMDMQHLDVEIGFPVTRALPGKGDITAGIIPAGKVTFCVYRGPYSGMEPVYGEMFQWIEQHGHKPAGAIYERYLNGPDRPEEELLTLVEIPVR